MKKETKKKMSVAKKGKKLSKEHSRKIAFANTGEKHHMYGKKHSAEALENMRGTRGPQKKTTCPHCFQTGGGSMMKRHHFDNCKEIS